jgi:protein-S-isoprenylcysteine O-methyltransferase Ste14
LAALAILALAYARKMGLEEEILQKTFGADWDEHRRRTWRLVPPVF